MLYRNFVAVVAGLLITCNAQSLTGETAVAGKKPCITHPAASGLVAPVITEAVKPAPTTVFPAPAPIVPALAPVVSAPSPATEVVVTQPVVSSSQKPGCRPKPTVAPLPTPETQEPSTLPAKEVPAQDGVKTPETFFNTTEAQLDNYLKFFHNHIKAESGKLPEFFQTSFLLVVKTLGDIDKLKKIVNYVEVNHYEKAMWIISRFVKTLKTNIPEADYNAIEDAVLHLNCQTGLLATSTYHNIMMILYSNHQY